MDRKEILEISMSDVVPNPHQPRQIFDEDSLLELADSISSHGLLQPIVVRKNKDEKYEIIAGERRFRASQLVGCELISAIVKDVDDRDSAYLAMIENIQRDDLHFIEVAKGYQTLMSDFSLTQTELVSVVGKSQSAIANKIRLLSMDGAVLEKLMDYDLSERHGRALLKIKDTKKQLKIVERIKAKGMTVSETEKYIDKLVNRKPKKEEKSPEIKRFIKDIRLFTNTIKQAVDGINSAGMNADYKVREEDDQYTITINIPKEH